MFFYWLNFYLLSMTTIILSNITFVIRPVWLLAGVISLTLGLFSKFSWWSFIVTKQLLSPLICNLFTTSLSFKIRLRSLSILSFIFFAPFLYLDVTAFCNDLSFSFLVRRYKLVVLSANVTVFLLWIAQWPCIFVTLCL